jgi:hypothetical protein
MHDFARCVGVCDGFSVEPRSKFPGDLVDNANVRRLQVAANPGDREERWTGMAVADRSSLKSRY